MRGQKPGKYNARGGWVEHAGKRQWIPSEAQLVRCHQLIALEKADMIGNLRFEVPVKLIVRNKLICTYRVDSVYDVLDEHGRPRRHVFEEVKGFVTADYVIKRKLFDAISEVPLSVIMIDGSLPEYDEAGERKRDEKGRAVRSRAEWMRQTWADRIPD